MRNPQQIAQDYYGGHLASGEEIEEATTAVAGGTGTLIGRAAVAGVLGGWLYAVYLAAPLLPSFVLGGLVGIVIGYALSERAARQPHGPGAVHLILVKTNDRLVTVRRYPTFRQRPLRSYPLGQISSMTSMPLPVGMYQRLILRMSDRTDLDLIIPEKLGLAIKPRDHKGDFAVD